ncbi:hypothetical protein EO244_00540 [Ancylomarina salipaludis]|uniref:KAP NTPase domain-containing protein n=1 Tax=Ancylomarina salipaludis TaxID=2501299 RepID=A0A4Q1JPT7_9BACT|nr:P-loop NTPase fold protein [Ancylomarina salipaludis]RXQ97409.1 hypothetical protein EO244_00540 [Ancylomarina salipaludis]
MKFFDDFPYNIKNSKEYYNVEIEFPAYIPGLGNEKLYYHVMGSRDIADYLEMVRDGSVGDQHIGARSFKIVQLKAIRIFDFSKVSDFNSLDNYGDYQEEYRKAKKVDLTPLEVYESLGRDVTNDFKIDLRKLHNVSGQTKEQLIDEIESHLHPEQISKQMSSGESRTSGQGNVLTDAIEPFTSGNGQGESQNNDPLYTELEFIKYNSYSIKDSKLPPAFQVEQIAEVFADHITEFKKDNGQMLCVTGKWGRGKTYFINKLCGKLNIDYETATSEDKSKFHFVKFHAWKYQDTPAIWAYLYKTLIYSYTDKISKISFWKPRQYNKSKYWQIFKLTVASKGHWNTWLKSTLLICFSFLWYFIFSFNEKLEAFKEISLLFGGTLALLLFIFKVLSFRASTKKPLKNLLQSFSKVPSFNQLLGFQAEIQTELIHLLKAWINKSDEKRLLLFIDDLDRCSEDRMIQIVDALRVMLEDPEITSRMIVLVAVDEEKLKKAIRHKYKDLYKDDEVELVKLENEYMDKLFISGIKLASLTKVNRVEFFETILKDENHPSFNEDSNSSDSSVEGNSSGAERVRATSDGGATFSQTSEESIGNSGHPNTSLPLEEEYVELSEHEIELFKIELEKKEDLSPRQIRILYYRYRLARNLWAKSHPAEQFPSEAIVTNLFLDKPKISEAQGKDILEMVRAY